MKLKKDELFYYCTLLKAYTNKMLKTFMLPNEKFGNGFVTQFLNNSYQQILHH